MNRLRNKNGKKKITVPVLREMKAKGNCITMLTAYDYPTRPLMERGRINVVLIGDSVTNVVLGHMDVLLS